MANLTKAQLAQVDDRVDQKIDALLADLATAGESGFGLRHVIRLVEQRRKAEAANG